MLRLAATALVGTLIVGGCGTSGNDITILEDQSILDAPIAGTSGGRTTVDSDAGRVTVLYGVGGDWSAVSVAIADAATESGWTIESVNCVGTGNDVIARKEVDGRWLLLESGAGTRGAGLILSFAGDERGPSPLSVTGRCPATLVDAAGG